METELMSFISNQGLAVGVSIFLIYWVTSEVSKSLEKIASFLNDHDKRTSLACEQVNKIYDVVVRDGN